MRILVSYSWPGNIRELENVIGRAIIAAGPSEDTILPIHILLLGTAPTSKCSNLRKEIGKLEKVLISQVLVENCGNRTLTAKKLGISKRSLYNKLAKYGLI